MILLWQCSVVVGAANNPARSANVPHVDAAGASLDRLLLYYSPDFFLGHLLLWLWRLMDYRCRQYAFTLNKLLSLISSTPSPVVTNCASGGPMSRIATTGQRLSRLTGPPASLVNPGTTDPLEATLAVPGLHVLSKLVADSKFSHYRCCLLGIVTWESSPRSGRHLVHLEGWEGGVRLRVVRTSVLAARRRRI